MKYSFLILFLILFSSCKKNEIKIVPEDGIDVKDLRIELKVDIEGKGYENFIIYDKGESKEIPAAYMKNYWNVYVKDSLVFSFIHYKGNRNYKHKYLFNLGLRNDTLSYTIDIKGKNKLLLSNKPG